MNISFTPIAWEDYQYWLNNDKKKIVKLNQLLKDIPEIHSKEFLESSGGFRQD